MRNNRDKYNSVSDLLAEFPISKDVIELYGVHLLINPFPRNPEDKSYPPLDKARLKIILKAKNANYSISNIKALIGVINPDKNDEDRLEECLIHCQKKYNELRYSPKDLDILEQINISCDLELLEDYKNELNNIKYGLNHNRIITKAPIKNDTSDSLFDARPTSSIFMMDSNKNKPRAPYLKLSLITVGILLISLSIYVYFQSDQIFGFTERILAIAESENAVAEEDKIESPGLINSEDTDPQNTLTIDPTSKEQETSPLGSTNQTAENNTRVLTDIDSGGQLTQPLDVSQTAASLLDALTEPQKKNDVSDSTVKKDSEDPFFKQLVADLQRKYDQKPINQNTDTNVENEEKESPETEPKATQKKNSLALAGTQKASQGTKTITNKLPQNTSAAAPIKKTDDKTTTSKAAPKNKTPLKSVSKKPSVKAATPVVTTVTPTDRSQTLISSNQPENNEDTTPIQEVTEATSTQPDLNQSGNTSNSTPPNDTTEPIRKTGNPEALKWTQKSYESVMAGNASEAIVTASVAITLDPGLVNAYINRSWAYSKKGLFDKAIQDCNQALAIDSNNPLAYNNRGLAHQGKGDFNKAKIDYEQACKLGFEIGCKNFQEVLQSLAKDS